MDASKKDGNDLKAFASFITGAALKGKNLLPYWSILTPSKAVFPNAEGLKLTTETFVSSAVVFGCEQMQSLVFRFPSLSVTKN